MRTLQGMFVDKVKTVLIACLLCIQTMGIRASVTLAWDPSPDTNVAGYYLCQGLSSGNYTLTNTLVGPITNFVVSGLVTGQVYFFAVAAYSADGLMSDFSNEVTYTNNPPPTPPGAPLAPSLPGGPPLPPPLAQQLDTNTPFQPSSGIISGGSTPALTASNKQVLIVGIPPSIFLVATNSGLGYAIWGTVGGDVVVQTSTSFNNPNSWLDVTNLVLTNAAQFGDGSAPAIPQDALDNAFIPAAEMHTFPPLPGAGVRFYRVKIPYSYPILADKVLKTKGYTTRLVVIRQPGDTIHDVCHVAQEQGYIECSDREYVLTLQRSGSTIREIANTYSDSVLMNWTTASEFIFTNGMRQVQATVVKTDPPELDPVAAPEVKSANIVIDF